MATIGVQPYWELMFDAEGDMAPGERDALVRGVTEKEITDLVVFAHGWNNTRSMATGLYDRFFAPFPTVLADAPVHSATGGPVRLGYGGVIWPSMRFTDEPIPDFPSERPPAAAAGPLLDPGTLAGLAVVFPGGEAVLDRLAELLERRPADPARLAEFAALTRGLVARGRGGRAAGSAADPYVHDLDPGAGEPEEPTMFSGSPERVCARFADALALAGLARSELSGALERLWGGALEMLRQGTYWEMKRRAGTVGEAGLGRLLGELAGASPGLRIHLAGHSFGGRLVAFALRGLPERARCVRSVTLLQGAFSHYAFAPRLPFAPGLAGALKELQHRVDGPVVCCHSSHDQALGVLYPLASRITGDMDSLLGLDPLGLSDPRWGAMGHDGVQAVPGTAALALDRALTGPFPADGCVNVDASAVIRRGGPPSGAHSDICHRELARLVLLAGRLVR
ncbi:serine-threonine protein kinase [Streptomyces hesseae]|uniref:Serine-threonine protein kinase n=1 Tax=Streptomyces hesseae TaxID=3075519 RepID=A0ABU2SQJ3_9ACTN|nr:serine-threonine protein kinase [Streptomyces sp. DSM 40473]MDT0451254.1 serine-threonine protein kinase [Streptomyces sp. DSM 40473]